MAARTVAEPDDRIQETQFSRQPESSEQDVDTNGALHAQVSSYGSVVNGQRKEPSGTTKAPRVLGPDLLRGLLMVLQAIDHAAVSSGAWGHGQGTLGEQDGKNVNTWISPRGWTARTLTHLCAPGFMFLLGMGVVYFGQSRSKLGWSNMAMIKHFFVRALVLALVNTAFGMLVVPGKLIIVNIVLLALAINYFLAGVFWLALNETEHALTRFLSSSSILARTSREETRPLLAHEAGPAPSQPSQQIRAANISFHIHNIFLTILTTLFVLLNSWMSPNNGHCSPPHTSLFNPEPSPSGRGAWFDFWFYETNSTRLFSGFPPLAWLSFALLGLLYARLVLSQPVRPARVINTANLAFGLFLFLLFAGTRIFHVGNLSEDCLHMPEHDGNPEHNQYLASFRSFFYVIKYPPSPAYFCYTMGVNFLLLAGFGAIPEKVARRIPGLLVFGTCALFFYMVHLLVYGVLSRLAKSWFGKEDPRIPAPGTGEPAIGIGDGWVFWCMWAIGLLILYPLCRWYGQFKSRRSPDSIFRFF